ncbi:MAG: DUF5749 family beta-barrel protein, partial [Candidatus Thermoplasmatota archaeon]|nr:DUF5749 family beta-barrel protein [Candidatus Thermoplasmatota archaeon]
LMPDLGSLLISYTDPTFLAAGAVAVGLGAYVIVTLRKQPEPTTDGNDAGRGRAGAKPQAEPAAQPATPEPAAGEAKPAKSALTPGKGRTMAQLAKNEEVENASLLSRFVLNASGDTVGETMALEGDQVILKTDEGFASVSLEDIIEKDGMLLVDANIDWDAAREAGQAWKQASTDEMQYDEKGMPVLE